MLKQQTINKLEQIVGKENCSIETAHQAPVDGLTALL